LYKIFFDPKSDFMLTTHPVLKGNNCFWTHKYYIQSFLATVMYLKYFWYM
jgi:hypothetical protein